MNHRITKNNQTIRELLVAYVQFADPGMSPEEIMEELKNDYPCLDHDILERVHRAAVATLAALGAELY